jgi:hypothetical protein
MLRELNGIDAILVIFPKCLTLLRKVWETNEDILSSHLARAAIFLFQSWFKGGFG